MNITEISLRKLRSREKKFIHFHEKAEGVRKDLETLVAPFIDFDVQTRYNEITGRLLICTPSQSRYMAVEEILALYKKEGKITMEMFMKNAKNWYYDWESDL